jgi:hypothetical protein
MIFCWACNLIYRLYRLKSLGKLSNSSKKGSTNRLFRRIVYSMGEASSQWCVVCRGTKIYAYPGGVNKYGPYHKTRMSSATIGGTKYRKAKGTAGIMV